MVLPVDGGRGSRSVLISQGLLVAFALLLMVSFLTDRGPFVTVVPLPPLRMSPLEGCG